MSHLSPLEGTRDRIAVFGGVYNNHIALDAVLEDACGLREPVEGPPGDVDDIP